LLKAHEEITPHAVIASMVGAALPPLGPLSMLALSWVCWAFVKAESMPFTDNVGAGNAEGLSFVQLRASKSNDAMLHETVLRRAVNCVACMQEGFVWCPTTAVTATGEHELGHCIQQAPVAAQCFNSAAECPTSPAKRLTPLAASNPSFATLPLTLTMRQDWDSSPMVDAGHKFIFCEQPKVSCTEFKRLFRRLAGRSSAEMVQHDDGPAEEFDWVHDPETNGVLRLADFPEEAARKMLLDSSWTKAVFVRDPLERLLSGYLDKCRMPVSARKSIWHCPNPSGPISFHDFVTAVVAQANDREGMSAMNPHWRPQHLNCDLDAWLNYYQFQGNFSHLAAHTKYLLQGLELFEDYGRGWRTYGQGWNEDDPSDGSDVFLEETLSVHKQRTLEKIKLYYTRELADIALKLYQMDYVIFSLPVPAWYASLL
jgi:hypothetical protein